MICWAQGSLGSSDRFAITLDPVRPTLIALSERPLAPPAIAGPDRFAARRRR